MSRFTGAVVHQRFDGEICGFGTTSGVRVVIGQWATSPFGSFADAMVEHPDGGRVPVAPNADLADSARDVLERLLSAGGELVTLVTGEDAEPGLAERTAEALGRERPEVEVVVIDGGQPVYPLLIGVE